MANFLPPQQFALAAQAAAQAAPQQPPPIAPFDSTPTGGATLEQGMVSNFSWDYGELAVPVAGPDGTPCEIVKLHAKMCFKRVPFHLQRVGNKPDIPSANTSNPNEILIRKGIAPNAPGIMAPQQEQVWTVDGVYEYVMRVPLAESDPIPCGSLTFDPTSPNANVFIAGDFSTSYFGTTPGVTVNGQKVVVKQANAANKLLAQGNVPGVVQNPGFIIVGQ
jgi:hypothetical protein